MSNQSKKISSWETKSIDLPEEYKGTILVSGRIDLTQFYYKQGESDADTVKIQVTENSMTFRPNDNAKWKTVNVFFKGFIKGKPVIHILKKTPGIKTITVRLQGIDAPELHYSAVRSKSFSPAQRAKWNTSSFRQHWGGRATYELVTMLERYATSPGSNVVEAKVISKVDSPNDLFDIYGRMIGDIVVSAKGKEFNINQWLASEGWAFPAFYVSMTRSEITIIKNKAKSAKDNSKGIWKGYAATLVPFDDKLTFSVKDQLINPQTDKGLVNFPKIFRRQTQYTIGKRSGVYHEASLGKYLADLKNQDYCFKTDDVLRQRNNKVQRYCLAGFVKDKIGFQPSGLVFEEKPSDLKDKNGKKITDWS